MPRSTDVFLNKMSLTLMLLLHQKLIFASSFTCFKRTHFPNDKSGWKHNGSREPPEARLRRIWPPVSSPQSFILPKELRQTWDQFLQQTSKLSPSHLTHTRFFFFLEGVTMMSSKDTSTPGSQLSHWGDLLSVSRRQCSAWSTHRLTQMQTAWLAQAQMHIVMLGSLKVCTHMCVDTDTNAFSRPITQWVIIRSTEKRQNPRLTECATFFQWPCWAQKAACSICKTAFMYCTVSMMEGVGWKQLH